LMSCNIFARSQENVCQVFHLTRYAVSNRDLSIQLNIR
jgi:hypothetical protein